ncbi:MAG TPA: Sir2 family NAD-dependent protein deacetylase [Polyangiaceae bacterium]|nr:Sir2 family NAD-dependent protein deacetylase [Polyangiaceae bacterium]
MFRLHMRVAPYHEFEALPFGSSTQLFVLTGAGISAESGIQTFRDSNGLWEQYDVRQVASPSGWAQNPALVWRFYSQRRAQARETRPNAAHVALAKLQARWENQVFLCTQNVDPLHEHAGSPAVVHMHGELFKSRCEREHAPPFLDESLYLNSDQLPRCDCGAGIRPHICWFGEVPFFMGEIERALSRCNLMVTIGSSGSVYPAAGFVAAARANGAKTVYVGPERPENATAFDECRLGTATEVVPSLFES